MFSSTVTANVEKSIHKQIKNVNYTSKLDINEPSSETAPIFKILENTGEIMNTCTSIIVSKKKFPS